MNGANQSQSGGTAEDNNEDQEDPSLSNSEPTQEIKLNKPKVASDALLSFRQQWQRELESSPVKQQNYLQNESIYQNQPATPDDGEEKAMLLFMTGVEYEQGGKLYEAIQYYKRAVQLVPDIEFKIYERNKTRGNTRVEAPGKETTNIVSTEGKKLAVLKGDLYTRIQKKLMKTGQYFTPENETKNGHISWLPHELLLYLLRWVVSADMDVLTLERLSSVSRGFYLIARDSEIWKMICVRTWGINCGSLIDCEYTSWRQMYIQRPHIRLNGCYISKTTYLRHGENSFQDQFYRPWYLIQYYRYLRFFPDGLVYMLTTADEPVHCISLLKHRMTRPNLAILAGHYRLIGDRIVMVMKKQQQNDKKSQQFSNTRFRARRKDSTQDNTQGQTSHMELQVMSHKWKRNYQLVWKSYTVFMKNKNGTESLSSFDLSNSKFPPFWFSRVKSYSAESEAILC